MGDRGARSRAGSGSSLLAIRLEHGEQATQARVGTVDLVRFEAVEHPLSAAAVAVGGLFRASTSGVGDRDEHAAAVVRGGATKPCCNIAVVPDVAARG